MKDEKYDVMSDPSFLAIVQAEREYFKGLFGSDSDLDNVTPAGIKRQINVCDPCGYAGNMTTCPGCGMTCESIYVGSTEKSN